MVNENEVLTKDHLKEIFTAENFGLMLERIDNVNEIMAKGREEGIALGIEKARTLTIGTFLLKMPDMSDEEVSNLFDVTVEYVRNLREKMNAG
jgi:flagellar biosynthesis/type III secretory pathway protein FliH